MKVLFVSSELNPLAKVGGLADVAGALPKSLKKLGVDIRLVIPKYSIIDETKYPTEKIVSDFSVVFGSVSERVSLFKINLPETEIPVYLIDNSRFFGENGVYFEKGAFCGSFKEIERFLFFSQAIVQLNNSGAFGFVPEIIHCNDFHTAIVALLLKLKTQNSKLKTQPKTLLTIHNLANQGKWEAKKILDFLGLKANEHPNLEIQQNSPKGGDLNLFQQGILLADKINTVSPTYAKEIKTSDFGCGLEKDIIKRKKDLVGILNGLDIDVFNPQTDPNIFERYSLDSLEKKSVNKMELQKELNLEINQNIPILGLVSRLTEQKGIDLVIEIAEELTKLNCQMIILGSGMEDYEKKLSDLSLKYPQKFSVFLGFNAVLAQKIYAASDLFLMPSYFEPCGLCQLIAFRYGAIPIIRKTGGLADTVKNLKVLNLFGNYKIFGNGFVFSQKSSRQFLKAIKRALKIYRNPILWQKIQKKVMNLDFSWQSSAKKYLKLYQKLLI